MKKDPNEQFMLKALQLAKKGIGSVEPNPAVGAVIVKNGGVIGKGYHKKFGFAHAEVNALEDCRKKRRSPKGATLYVSLEPCCVEGKTPACTDAVIQAGISNVYAACVDPSPQASGKGLNLLRKAGIEVHTGLCENEAKLLNAPFIKYVTTKKPWIIVKWAQTLDGKLAYTDTNSNRWISNETSRKEAHHLRRRVQAVLVGVKTVLADDPLLTPRPARGKSPTRIVLDRRLRTPLTSQLLQTVEQSPVLIVTTRQTYNSRPKRIFKLTQKGAQILVVPSKDGKCDLVSLLRALGRRHIYQLLVEGGPNVITSFLQENLADEIHVFIAPKILAAAGSADLTKCLKLLKDSLDLQHVETRSLDGDIHLRAYTPSALKSIQ